VKASIITKDSAVNGEGEGNGVTEPKEFSSTARVEERVEEHVDTNGGGS
jgi:hypothetical protein